MPNIDHELEVAHLIARYSAKYRAIYLGPLVHNDDGSEDLQFDVCFDSAKPPVALEITSIVDPNHIATSRISSRIAEELTELASRENLGRWHVEVIAGTKLKPIKQDILKVIKGEKIKLPDGVVSISEADGGEPDVVIYTWSSDSSELEPLIGITPELEKALKDNSQKLGRAHGYERHLAVDLLAQRASDPSRSPVPILPPEIDVLWVVNRWSFGPNKDPVVWWTTRAKWSLSHDWPPSGGLRPIDQRLF